MKLKVRCPHCTKLYEVSGEEIHSEIPVFQCVTCESRFAFEYPPENPEQVDAFLLSANEASLVAPSAEVNNANSQKEIVKETPKEALSDAVESQAMKSCPKCGAMNGRRSKECYSCHVLFERLEGLPQDPSLKAQPSLVRKWKNLLENFENQELHDEFIRSCQKLDALRFATSKYEEIKAAQGGDALCDRMIAQINSLMMVNLAQKPLAKETAEKTMKPKWQKYLFWGPYALSAMLILLGMMNLGHRNLIGLGVAIACMASGVIVMIRGKISASDFLD